MGHRAAKSQPDIVFKIIRTRIYLKRCLTIWRYPKIWSAQYHLLDFSEDDVNEFNSLAKFIVTPHLSVLTTMNCILVNLASGESCFRQILLFNNIVHLHREGDYNDYQWEISTISTFDITQKLHNTIIKDNDAKLKAIISTDLYYRILKQIGDRSNYFELTYEPLGMKKNYMDNMA